jgi:hypothetical protein
VIVRVHKTVFSETGFAGFMSPGDNSYFLVEHINTILYVTNSFYSIFC